MAVTLVASRVAESVSADRARERSSITLTTLAQQVAVKLDRGMFALYREFQLLSTKPTLGDPAIPVEEKQRLLDQMQRTHPAYAWIGATDRQGKVIAAAQGLLVGADVSQRPWFANALQERYVGDVHEAVLLASRLPNPDGEPLRFVDIAFPYHDPAGNIAGILGAHLLWSWADGVHRAVLARHAAGLEGVQVFIAAGDGTVVLGPKGTVGGLLRVRGGDGDGSVATVERWPDAGRFVAGYSRTRGFQSYPGLGWSVVVRLPAAIALAPSVSLGRRVMWSGFALALLCLAFGFAPRSLSRG
ncbi:MAG TPA: cache domain-containing protein [Burkholderiales bacterium]|nr:cache domain-containing protein [Burkholderiales bacterium]